ncbi:MAG: DUF2254 domain-containing protein [Erysipelothrix sp.]|nr:DUF2254 domain-containing protein [Erysipelothrix sp.]
MKKIINKLKTSIWLYPMIYSMIALLLSIGISIIDRKYSTEMSVFLGDMFYTTTSLAQAILGIVAGAFITIATFTFSTTMVVLTMYSSQFTPRVVENFLNNKTTMKSFGVFLSGFIYAITSLLYINTSANGNLVISASVGVIYVIVGLVYFLLFIHNVSTHIQASDLIRRLHEEAMKRIRQYHGFIKESKIISEAEMKEMIESKKSMDINSPTDGYIQEIDYPRLQKIAEELECILCFKKVVGQFVVTETRVLTIYYKGKKTFEEDVISNIHECIWIGNKKTQSQDFGFSIQKIVEIALKALSPGINDPNTAIHCLKIIGVLLRDLADIDKGYIVLKKEESGFIIYEAYDFEFLLYDAYNQIMFYGQADASVMIAGFKSLRFIRDKASKENIKIVDAYAKYILDKKSIQNFDKLDYDKIYKEYLDLIN